MHFVADSTQGFGQTKQQITNYIKMDKQYY